MKRVKRPTCEQLFAHTAPDNPLRQFAAEEKRLVHAGLVLFATTSDEAETHPIDELRQLALNAHSLAHQIDRQLLKGTLIEQKTAKKFVDLPAQLMVLADTLTYLTSQSPKPGQAPKVFKSELLVGLSEFVKAKTGKYNDRALAELLQQVVPLRRDFSEDSIQKRRTRLKHDYPLLYDAARVRFFGDRQNTEER